MDTIEPPNATPPTTTLILGGARSGKSDWAERLAFRQAAGSGRPVLFLATATAGDAEMADRIAAHRAARPAAWRTVEEPADLAAAVRDHARAGEIVLIDCLTLWVSNRLLGRLGADADLDALPGSAWTAIEAELLDAAADLLATARQRDLSLILVSNEVGLGLVPPTPLGRRYRDALGRVNRLAAAAADPVILMVAGLPVDLRRLAPALGAHLADPRAAAPPELLGSFPSTAESGRRPL